MSFSGTSRPLISAAEDSHDNDNNSNNNNSSMNSNDHQKLLETAPNENQPNPLLCNDCASKLCDSCQQVLQTLLQRDRECGELYNVSFFRLAMGRLPALLITMCLELAGGLVIAKFNHHLQKFIVLASFMPSVSALSGNMGLQASSNVTRGLATGNVTRSGFRQQFKKEFFAGVTVAFVIAASLGVVGAVWVEVSGEKAIYDQIHLYPLVFGATVGLGSICSMLISSTFGTLVPFAAHKFGLDPAKVSGPFETAFQDIAGASFILGLSYLILTPLLEKN